MSEHIKTVYILKTNRQENCSLLDFTCLFKIVDTERLTLMSNERLINTLTPEPLVLWAAGPKATRAAAFHPVIGLTEREAQCVRSAVSHINHAHK